MNAKLASPHTVPKLRRQSSSPDTAYFDRGVAGHNQCLRWADAVEKGFFSSERARLIQDQASQRNVDSRKHSPRFDCCVFLFHSVSAATFSTASVKPRPPRSTRAASAN